MSIHPVLNSHVADKVTENTGLTAHLTTFHFICQSLGAGLAPLKGEGSLAPLGRSLGTGSSPGGTLGVGSLGTGPLGGGSLGRGSLGGSSLGDSLGKNSLNGSLNTAAKGGLGSGGRFPTAEQHKDPFRQARLGGIKDPPGVRRIFYFYFTFGRNLASNQEVNTCSAERIDRKSVV